MSLLDWLSLAGVCLLGAMSPGPSLAVVVNHTLRAGAGAGIKAGLAHGCGVALYAVLVVSGLALVITASPMLYQSIQWAGAAFLLYLGLQSLRSSGAVQLDSSEANGKLQGPAVQGFAIAFLNPKLAVFFLALFSQFLRAEAALAEKTLMVATVGGIDALWYCAVSLLLARPGMLQRLRASQQIIDRLFGLILIALAIRVAFA